MLSAFRLGGHDEMSTEQRAAGKGCPPEINLFLIRCFFKAAVAVDDLRPGDDLFPKMFGFRERLLVQSDVYKACQTEIEVKLRKRPWHDMHVRAPNDLSDEARETGEKTPN